MPRYELVDGKSNKFWEIELEDESFTVRYGRIGTDGQEQTKDFDSRAEAKKAYQKLIDEKTKKGYVLVGGGAGVVAKSNPELEAAIEKDPNDLQAYLVYGDWLQANGDPRGELVAIQARLAQLPRPKGESAGGTGRQRRRGPDGIPGNLEFPEAPTGKDAAALVEAAQKILADSREHFYGDLAELVEGDGGEEGIRIEWYCGFIRSLRLSLTYDQFEEQAADFGTLLAAVIKHPSARFLRHLSLGMFDYEGENHYPSVVKALAKLPVPPTLRTLYLGDFTFPDENEISWVEVGNVSALYAKMPNLETLILQGGGIELGKTLELPKLSTLVLRTGGLPKAALKSIASSSLPELETLVVWTGAKNYGATSTLADVRPILEGKNLPKLRHLTIADSEYADELAQEIASAPILPRLRTLDLSMGLLSDAGAAALAAHPEAFAHLDELVLDESYLTDAGIQAVSKLGKSRSTAEQRTPYVYNGEEHRYVSVGE